MGVRLVKEAVMRPQSCACIPLMTNSREPVGFFDFGSDLDGEHVYVSFSAFLEMADLAQAVGWVAPAGPKATGEVSRLLARLEAARAETARLQGQVDAVQVLKNGGFAQQKAAGRPPKQKAGV